MSNGVNQKNGDRSKIFETVLSSPGMHEACKIVLNPTRQTILILAKLIENGVEKNGNEHGDELLPFIPEESLNELKSIAGEILKKGGLVEFYEHLKQL